MVDDFSDQYQLLTRYIASNGDIEKLKAFEDKPISEKYGFLEEMSMDSNNTDSTDDNSSDNKETRESMPKTEEKGSINEVIEELVEEENAPENDEDIEADKNRNLPDDGDLIEDEESPVKEEKTNPNLPNVDGDLIKDEETSTKVEKTNPNLPNVDGDLIKDEEASTKEETNPNLLNIDGDLIKDEETSVKEEKSEEPKKESTEKTTSKIYLDHDKFFKESLKEIDTTLDMNALGNLKDTDKDAYNLFGMLKLVDKYNKNKVDLLNVKESENKDIPNQLVEFSSDIVDTYKNVDKSKFDVYVVTFDTDGNVLDSVKVLGNPSNNLLLTKKASVDIEKTNNIEKQDFLCNLLTNPPKDLSAASYKALTEKSKKMKSVSSKNLLNRTNKLCDMIVKNDIPSLNSNEEKPNSFSDLSDLYQACKLANKNKVNSKCADAILKSMNKVRIPDDGLTNNELKTEYIRQQKIIGDISKDLKKTPERKWENVTLNDESEEKKVEEPKIEEVKEEIVPEEEPAKEEIDISRTLLEKNEQQKLKKDTELFPVEKDKTEEKKGPALVKEQEKDNKVDNGRTI